MRRQSGHRVLLAPLGGLLLLAGNIAHADSGVGVDMWRGNVLDPRGGADSRPLDPRGTSWLSPMQRRSPSGNLYLCPAAKPEQTKLGEWLFSGSLDIGFVGVGGDEDNALWNRYADWEDGFILGLAQLEFLRPRDGSYASLRASRISDDDAYFDAMFGRAGSYKVHAFLRELPNALSDSVRSIWNGVGSNHLTLVDPLQAGASTSGQVGAASQAAIERQDSVNRSKQGLGFSMYLDPRWSAYADVSNEQRKGARPFGGAMFFNFPFPDNGGILETLRPVDDATVNLNTGLRYAGSKWRLDFAYSGSFYRDRYTRFDYGMPYALSPVIPGAVSAPLQHGQFATEPDNDYHNIKAAITRKLGNAGEFSLTASLGRMSQNDSLIAPIDCQGVFGIGLGGSLQLGPQNPFLFDCSQWNSNAALPRTRADMRIDTSLVDGRIVLHPLESLSVRAGLRFNREDYRGSWLAFNPLNGAYGYVSENGAQGSVVPGEVGFWYPGAGASNLTRIRNLPLDLQTTEANLGADWRISEGNSIGADLVVNRFEPGNREREQVDFRRISLNWTNRALDWLTLRAKLSHLRQNGDRYNHDPYDFTFSSSLPGFVEPEGGVPAHTVDALRKFDLASRDEDKFSLIATIALGDDMTLGASLNGMRNDYDASLGRQSYDTHGGTVQWDWQPNPRFMASAYFGRDFSTLELANVNDQALDPDPSLGGPTYPLDAVWSDRDRQRNAYAGASFKASLKRVTWDGSWTWINARGSNNYAFASPSALAYFSDGSSVPGNAFPDTRYRVNAISMGLRVPLGERLSLRVFDTWARGRFEDWHYAGMDETRVIEHRVYTDGGPRGYRNNLLGMLLQVRL